MAYKDKRLNKKENVMKNGRITFVALTFLLTGIGCVYYYFTGDTHTMIFWGILTLLNGQNLDRLRLQG